MLFSWHHIGSLVRPLVHAIHNACPVCTQVALPRTRVNKEEEQANGIRDNEVDDDLGSIRTKRNEHAKGQCWFWLRDDRLRMVIRERHCIS